MLPTGTGNDIARSVGIPLYPEEAASVAAHGDLRWMDLVETNLGSFVHAAGIGMVADFAAATRDTKGWRRPLVYPYRSWQAWHRRGPLPIEVTVDGELVTFPSLPLEIAVVNAPRVGGRIGVTLPGARADDGLVELVGIYRVAVDRRSAAWSTGSAPKLSPPPEVQSCDAAAGWRSDWRRPRLSHLMASQLASPTDCASMSAIEPVLSSFLPSGATATVRLSVASPVQSRPWAPPKAS